MHLEAVLVSHLALAADVRPSAHRRGAVRASGKLTLDNTCAIAELANPFQ